MLLGLWDFNFSLLNILDDNGNARSHSDVGVRRLCRGGGNGGEGMGGGEVARQGGEGAEHLVGGCRGHDQPVFVAHLHSEAGRTSALAGAGRAA